MPIIPEMPIMPPREMDGSDRSEERLRDSEGNGKVRKKGRRGFGEKRVGVAYRELIGSLYESWTIGIERVYK